MGETERLLGCTSELERRHVLGELFEAYRPRLERVIELRLDDRLRSRLDASDVVQETFIEVSRRIVEFVERPEVPLFIWVRFLALQRLQLLHRHHLGVQARDPRREVSLFRGASPGASSQALAARLVGHDTSPSRAAVRAERKLILEGALNALDPIDREIIALRSFEQLSSREAGQVLGIQEGTARQRYFQALRRLRATVEKSTGLKESTG